MKMTTLKTSILFHLWLMILTVTANGTNDKEENIAERRVAHISYQKLYRAFSSENDDQCSSLLQELEDTCQQAFDPEGLGFLEITDIPPEMTELRSQVLQRAQTMANLAPSELEQITLPETSYTIGWSHGKEQFRGVYDTQKASFYFNPFAKNDINAYPTSMQPDLEHRLMEMTQFMKEVGMWVAKLCDLYLSQKYSASQAMIQNSLDDCQNAKARLLYYFPPSNQNSLEDDWCGWHKDHGSLTVLLPGLLFDDDVSAPDIDSSTKAGLYIQSSGTNITHHVHLPPTSLGIQIGETVAIQSHGQFRATPHAVKSGSKSGGRASLALFLQPMPDQSLPKLYSDTDDSLAMRWRSTFADFQKATIKAFN
jgi:isopenicillin N synthase-like dioxygenase